MADIEDWVADYRTTDTGNSPADTDTLAASGAGSLGAEFQELKSVIRQYGITRMFEPDWQAASWTDGTTLSLTVASSATFIQDYPPGTPMLWDSDTDSSVNRGGALMSPVAQDPTTVLLTCYYIFDGTGNRTTLPNDTGYRIKPATLKQQVSVQSHFVTSNPIQVPSGNFSQMKVRGMVRGGETMMQMYWPARLGNNYSVSAQPVASDGASLSVGAFLVKTVYRNRDSIQIEVWQPPDASSEPDMEKYVEWEVIAYPGAF